MTKIEELNATLLRARNAYAAGAPLMSDAKFDRLERTLASLVRQHPDEAGKATVLTTVGSDLTAPPVQSNQAAATQAPPISAPGRIPHKYPMRSIQNFYSVAEVVAWYQKVAPGEPASVSSKWDGVSGSLTYENGDLRKAVTRGDGDAGESIFDQVLAMSGIPKRLNGPAFPFFEIRGEFVMRRSVMERLNAEIVAQGGKPYMSTRNLVAGTLKLKDLAEVTKREIEFRPWEVFAEPGEITINFHQWTSAVGLLKLTPSFGFVTPDDILVNNADELERALEAMIPSLSEANPEIGRDGIVIKIDSMQRRSELGLGSKFANFQICYKPQNARTESVLREVLWQTGRHGKLTPVGVIDPVVLAGAEVRRATLNHLNWIKDMGLKIGSRVEIIRSGDVIPQIVGVLDEV
jgi:DNA ligase (NAD+)